MRQIPVAAQQANPDRAVKLVRRQRERSRFQIVEVDGDLANRLDRVEMQRNSEPHAPSGERLCVQNHAGLVMGQDRAGQADFAPRQVVQPILEDAAVRIDVEQAHPPAALLERTACLAGCRMFTGGAEDRGRLFGGKTEDRQIDRLGAAAGEDHLLGICTEHGRDPFPRVLQSSACDAAFCVRASRIGKALAVMGRQGVHHFGQGPRAGIVIQENALHGRGRRPAWSRERQEWKGFQPSYRRHARRQAGCEAEEAPIRAKHEIRMTKE